MAAWFALGVSAPAASTAGPVDIGAAVAEASVPPPEPPPQAVSTAIINREMPTGTGRESLRDCNISFTSEVICVGRYLSSDALVHTGQPTRSV